MALHNDFGRWGENVASRYLEEHGFTIVARNWRHLRKEVDIIAQKDDCLYFVEVKTRHGELWSAEAAVTPQKRMLLMRASVAWKVEHPSPLPVRYAVIAVVKGKDGEQTELRWHEDMWDL